MRHLIHILLLVVTASAVVRAQSEHSRTHGLVNQSINGGVYETR